MSAGFLNPARSGWMIVEGKKVVRCFCGEDFVGVLHLERHMREDHPKHPHTKVLADKPRSGPQSSGPDR